ncbi:MAG: 3-phosphoshikimate 1-carboxyvinyltransferase [Selenomonadaceae bacterium]|nr:3-phosphoshikimate 1-carboxyvinyltransferase [Selenomonadaceae bacterium]
MTDEIKTIKKIERGMTGEIKIPGDKSISHRSVILSSLATTPIEIKNFLRGADCLSTLECMRALSVQIEDDGKNLLVTGHGLHGLKEPESILDAGNSGTTLRLLLGLLASQRFFTTFTGDKSLSKRPMGRVIRPLSKMGARIYGRAGGKYLPITILPASKKIHGIAYEMPVSSAQVKSALLLAGLYSVGNTTIFEPYPSRDHTERMMEAFGVDLERRGNSITIQPITDEQIHAPETIEVPGDISSAMYWIVLATILEGSDILIRDVGINPTRTGAIDILKAMGANIDLTNIRTSSGEQFADVHVTSAKLHGTSFGEEIIPRLIDEIPILAVAAAFADGETVITGASELRVKETDRLSVITTEYNRLMPGAFKDTDSTLTIIGGRKIKMNHCSSHGDHRIAMSLAIFGALGEGVDIVDPSCVDISYPEFYETLGS